MEISWIGPIDAQGTGIEKHRSNPEDAFSHFSLEACFRRWEQRCEKMFGGVCPLETEMGMGIEIRMISKKSLQGAIWIFFGTSALFIGISASISRADGWSRGAFPKSMEIDDRFVQEKLRWRERRFLLPAEVEKSESSPADRAEDLVDRLELRNLDEMEKRGLTSAQLDESPWSDDYWPIYTGILSKRFVDPKFPDSLDWKVNIDYLLKQPNHTSVDNLSPAEKYDLIVGDPEGGLKRAMIEEGRDYFEKNGKVESWMGICHGWAPASYMMPRPAKAIRVLAADGRTEINLYPSDIKGLTSLLWAKADFETRYIGGRCNTKNPPLDPAGRPIQPDCLDTNPGTWHLAVVNQLGVARRSLIMDATYDYEVWNQPIYSYNYRYFNPIDRKKAASWKEARVAISDLARDPYRGYRSPRAESVVGVEMNVSYVVETEASDSETDSEVDDKKVTAKYVYDLELDADDEIVGGEWRKNLHPDFLWTPVPDAKAMTSADRLLDRQHVTRSWAGNVPVPAEWIPAASRMSKLGQPLDRIVHSLGVLSRLGL